MQQQALLTLRQSQRVRHLIYPAILATIYTVWVIYMTLSQNWTLFYSYWPASLTMVLGSFVAGITAEGGGAVAFPVFTKVLHIASADARTFSLMIQTFGMGMASVFIVSRGIKVLPRVIFFVSLGGIFGHMLGLFWFPLPAPYPKILFTFVTTAFGVALFISRWGLHWTPQQDLPQWTRRHRVIFVVLGVFGGMFAANVGSGIDVVTFIVLTLMFGVNEKISTPTTVIIMGLNSIVGFIFHSVVAQDISPDVWRYWLVAVPIVIVGAPLGAFVGSKVSREAIIIFLLSLIGIELMTTLWLVPFTAVMWQVTIIATVAFGLCFAAMLYYRHNYLPRWLDQTGEHLDEE
ncbi:MAG: permease [Anaerolineaceae bacterium]|nr:permease [Anaerolineaceae bacterium]